MIDGCAEAPVCRPAPCSLGRSEVLKDALHAAAMEDPESCGALQAFQLVRRASSHRVCDPPLSASQSLVSGSSGGTATEPLSATWLSAAAIQLQLQASARTRLCAVASSQCSGTAARVRRSTPRKRNSASQDSGSFRGCTFASACNVPFR